MINGMERNQYIASMILSRLQKQFAPKLGFIKDEKWYAAEDEIKKCLDEFGAESGDNANGKEELLDHINRAISEAGEYDPDEYTERENEMYINGLNKARLLAEDYLN